MSRKCSRRRAIHGIVSTTAISSLGIGSVSASTPQDQKLLTEFDPSELDEIRRVWSIYASSDKSSKNDILRGFDDQQEEAFRDANSGRYLTRTKQLKVTEFQPAPRRTADQGISIERINTNLPDKWGWDVNQVTETDNPISVDVGITGDDVGTMETHSGTSTYTDDIESTTYLGFTKYKWEHSITWDWSYDYSTEFQTYSNKSVSNGRNSHQVLDTGSGWTYVGVVSETDYYNDSSDPTEYHSDRQVMFEDEEDGLDAYPHIDLMGAWDGYGTTKSKDNS